MKRNKKERVKLPMSLAKKIMLTLAAAVAAFAVIYLIYYVVRFKSYNGHKKYLQTYDYEQGTEMHFIDEAKSSVPGFKLVAENEYLKLYTDTETCNVAVYDKRNGSVSYTNPVNADKDTIAKSVNKNYLKAQFILQFYNTAVASANYDSYSKSVASKNYKYEGIENGIRYVYSVGEPQNIGKEGDRKSVV